nr:hypothetical protein [Tanacetum cinerariifolium]
MEVYHRLLTDQVDLVNPKGHRLVPDVSKPLPLRGPPVRSHMQILSVISIKTFERYGYAFLREIVIRKADYNEYKISEADFKNLHPNDFEDLYLLHLQGKLNHLPGLDKVHLYNAINLLIRNIVIKQCVGDLIWSEDDKRRSGEFMEAIKGRIMIRRIFLSLKSFVGGRFRDVDYRTINRTK